MSRVVEVYTGAYTSGKSEISINRALALSKVQQQVTLVDLDTVEPAYTLRPIKNDLEKLGIKLITLIDAFGLGEAGNVITGEQKTCLSNPGTIVIDVGYGVGGLDILEVINGIDEEKNLKIYIIINASKHETSTVDNIVEYVKWSEGSGARKWKKFSGIISNTHFGDETELQDVIKGYEITKQAAEKLDLPIIAISASQKVYEQFEADSYDNLPIWPLNRYMPKALW